MSSGSKKIFSFASTSVFAGIVAVGLLLSIAAFQITRNLEEKTIYSSQQRATELLTNGLNRQNRLYVSVLRAIRSLFAASEHVSREEFRRFVSPYLKLHPEIQALEWAPRVRRDERETYERLAKEDGIKGFRLTEQHDQKQMKAARTNDEYFPVYYVEPLVGNEKVLGFNLASDALRNKTIQSAWRMRETRATPSVALIQDDSQVKNKGFLLLLPYFSQIKAPDSEPELEGFVLGVFRILGMFHSAQNGLQAELEGLNFNLDDISEPGSPEPLYAGANLIKDDKNPLQRWQTTMQFVIEGRSWRLTSQAEAGFIESRRSILPNLVFFICILLTASLSFYVWSLIRREREIRQLVEDRTKDLNASEKRLGVILNNAEEAIIAIDGRGNILLFNPAAEDHFGYRAQEVLNQNVRMLMPEPYQSEHDKYLARYNETREAHVIGVGREVAAKRKDGSVFPMHLSLNEASIDNDPIYVGVLVDLTLRKAHEQALIRGKEIAEEANRQKSSFLNMMSHELRTPLTIILGYLPLLRDKKYTLGAETVRQIADDMSRSGNHLLELINDLLDISKIEAGQLTLHIEKVDVRALTQEVCDRFQLLAQKKEIRLSNQVEPIEFSLDAMRFSQILINLIGNALKFTSQGEVRITGNRENGALHIEVIDTGCGIPKQDLSQIFEAFHQVDSTRTRTQGGSGLGLAITKRLVALHNGSINVESEPGKGSRFYVTLEKTGET